MIDRIRKIRTNRKIPGRNLVTECWGASACFPLLCHRVCTAPDQELCLGMEHCTLLRHVVGQRLGAGLMEVKELPCCKASEQVRGVEHKAHEEQL